MSFKREGDDHSLLANLQKKLVGELLGSHIPSNEARLLSNGRFTCTVCSYGPIFDTVEVLAIHRKGKKHLQSLARLLDRQNESCEDVHLGVSTDNTNEANSRVINRDCDSRLSSLKTFAAFERTSPYSNCCKKRKKLTDRKISLNIKPRSNSSEQPAPATPTIVSSYLKSIKSKSSFKDEVEIIKRQQISAFSVKEEKTESCKIPAKSPVFKPSTNESQFKDQRDENRRNLDLFKDGWILNAKGEWIKDENAEFDSDEETPVTTILTK